MFTELQILFFNWSLQYDKIIKKPTKKVKKNFNLMILFNFINECYHKTTEIREIALKQCLISMYTL